MTVGKPDFEFPAKGKCCPRCKTWDTAATSTQGNVQYRKCRRVVCRWTYSVLGRPVTSNETASSGKANS